MHSLNRRAWVDVDLGALLHNAATVSARAGVPMLPMVKADAYGLGAVRVARTLERLEPWGYGVATVAEGEELRRAGIARPIIIFTPLLVGDFDAAARANLTPTLGTREAIERWGDTRRPWHLSIDTGMSRAGVPWNCVSEMRDVIKRCIPQGAMTHFHSAEANDGSRELQERRFDQAIAELPVEPELLHAENSPAVQHGGLSRWSLVRPGVFLYGVTAGESPAITPRPVVSLRARVVDLRTIDAGESVSYGATYRATAPTRVATLAIGYADGYRRALGNRASVLVHGRRAPVIGVVTMDMTMVDVTNVECGVGDIVTLIGKDGDDELTVNEVAAFAGLSPYEVLTGLRGRLAHRYVNGDEPEGEA